MSDGSASFSVLLRQFRNAASLSQGELAERSGLSVRGISDLERGLRHAPRLETVRLLADALALTDNDRAALMTAARPALWPDEPAARARPAHGSLPTPLTRLIGREAELVALCTALGDDEVRLVTVTGAGGVGKTRLAIAVAVGIRDAFPDGVVYVDLSPLNDPALLIPTIATTLGVQEAAGQPLLQTLSAALEPRRLLLLLDNCERVLAAAPDLVALLTGSPQVTIFATGREAWHVGGEHAFSLGPLPLPADRLPAIDELAQIPAIALFMERSSAVHPDFALSVANADVVAAICQRLDGLPLAIELAAARIKILPLAALLARLEQLLPVLAGGSRDLPARLRTMRDAIAWSYDFLSDEEVELFRRLAVFVGGFTLEAAEWVGRRRTEDGSQSWQDNPSSVLRLPSDTLDLLAGLIDKSLLQQMAPNRPERRFTMLETVREFALEKLASSGEAETIAALQATWCVHLAEGVRQAGGVSQGIGLAMLEVEHPNLRAALTWLLERGEVTSALYLAGELAEFWLRHGHWTEGAAWLERALAADDGCPTAARANALVGLNMLLWPRDEFARAQRLLGEAERVARAAGDAGALAYARLHQGYVAAFQGDLDLAVARGEECLTTCAAIPQEFSCNGALWLLASATLARGEDERATDLYKRLLASGRAEGDEISVANGHAGLAVLAERRGELGPAVAGFAEAATVCHWVGQAWMAGGFLVEAAVTAVSLGRREPAVRLLAAVDALRTAIGAAAVPAAASNMQRHEQALAVARTALGAESFAEAWTAGLALSFDEAIAEATTLARWMTSPDDPTRTSAHLDDRDER